jgi:hypothetical protein
MEGGLYQDSPKKFNERSNGLEITIGSKGGNM